jgi:hypothetical protein
VKTEVLLELLPDRRYRATGTGRFAVSVEGDTREEALQNFQRAARATVPAHAEVVSVDVPLARYGEPSVTESDTSLVAEAEGWRRLQGFLSDEPLFDDWQAAIAARRRRADTESPAR